MPGLAANWQHHEGADATLQAVAHSVFDLPWNAPWPALHQATTHPYQKLAARQPDKAATKREWCLTFTCWLICGVGCDWRAEPIHAQDYFPLGSQCVPYPGQGRGGCQEPHLLKAYCPKLYPFPGWSVPPPACSTCSTHMFNEHPLKHQQAF